MEHQERYTAQLLCAEFYGVRGSVPSQILEQTALAHTIRGVQRNNLPANPRSLSKIEDIEPTFRKKIGRRAVLSII